MSAYPDTILQIDHVAPRTMSFSAPFWEGTRQKKILMQYCLDTGQYQFYPRPVSVFTGSRRLEWREVSGLGEIFTYTIARVGRDAFATHTPYIIATIALDAGVTIVSNIIECGLDEIAIGMRVKPAWAPLPDGTNLLLFAPDRAS